MKKRIYAPKFIKNANCWMVAIFPESKDKEQDQKMNWFPTEEEALKFYEENK
jgi:hypothetical protein